MSSITPSPFSRLATAVVSGLVSIGAQTWTGVKTFANAVVMSAGLTITGAIVGDGGMTSSAGSSIFTLNESLLKGQRGTARWSLNEGGAGSSQLYNTSAGVEVTVNGTLIYGRASDVADFAVKLGTMTSDGATHASARLLSVGTGIYGAYVEKFWVDKAGNIRTTLNGKFRGSSGANGAIYVDDSVGAGASYLTYGWTLDSANFTVTEQATSGPIWRLGKDGKLSLRGTDSTGTPGAAAIDKTIGKSAVAAAATAAVITNNLVTAASHIIITPMENGTANAEFRSFKVTAAAGSFTVTLSSAVTVAWPFSWEVKGII